MLTTRSGRRLAIAAAAVVMLAQGGAGAADPLRLTKPVQATKEDQNPSRLYQAPAMAIDPQNPKNVVAAFVELRAKRCGLMRSADGGQTWRRLDASPLPASYPFCNTNNRGSFQAQTAFGRNGNLYYAAPGWDTQDAGTRGNVSVLVGRSTNLGDSWQTTVARNNRGKQGDDQENVRPVSGIAVDAKTGSDDSVYVVYASRKTNAAAPNAAPNTPSVIVSTDGGRKFGGPVNLAPTVFSNEAARQKALSAVTTIPNTTTTTAPPPGSRAAQPNQEANFGGFGPSVAVDDKGTVYVAWPSAYANISPGPPNGIFVSKSTDKGRTWTTSQVGDFVYTNGSFIQLGWSRDGGNDGSLHLLQETTPDPKIAGLRDISYWRSTDGARTWTGPKNLTDDDPAGLYGQYYPNIAVAPNGRLDVVFYDTRNDPGYRANDVYYTYSTDNGTTWSKNERVTDRTIDRRMGVWTFNYDMTTPPSLAATNAYAIVGWDDTRFSDPAVGDNLALGGGLQDIFTADVQFAAIGGGASKAAKLILAGVMGLVLVGLVLLAVALVARGRGELPPRTVGKPAARKPAKVS